MFTLIAEAQEVGNEMYADVLKDERNEIFLAVEIDVPAGLGFHQDVAIVHISNLSNVVKNANDLESVRGYSYKLFEDYAKYCKWYGYNVQS